MPPTLEHNSDQAHCHPSVTLICILSRAPLGFLCRCVWFLCRCSVIVPGQWAVEVWGQRTPRRPSAARCTPRRMSLSTPPPQRQLTVAWWMWGWGLAYPPEIHLNTRFTLVPVEAPAALCWMPRKSIWGNIDTRGGEPVACSRVWTPHS